MTSVYLLLRTVNSSNLYRLFIKIAIQSTSVFSYIDRLYDYIVVCIRVDVSWAWIMDCQHYVRCDILLDIIMPARTSSSHSNVLTNLFVYSLLWIAGLLQYGCLSCPITISARRLVCYNRSDFKTNENLLAYDVAYIYTAWLRHTYANRRTNSTNIAVYQP